MRKLVTLALIFCGAVSSGQNSMNVDLLFNWKDTTLVPSFFYNNTYNEIWGFVENGREYGVIGTTSGTHIFDVTDPANSIEVDFIPGAFQGGNVVHRDYHDYDSYMYIVCDEGPSTMQIVDLSYLPDSVHLVYDSDSLLTRAHNIFIDTASAVMYACGPSGQLTNYGALMTFSLADPENPALLLDFDHHYFHDIYVRNGIAYGNNGGHGTFVFDFTDPANPVEIGSLVNYPDKGYNHSGWMSDDGNNYFFADETHGYTIKSTDITDINDIQVIDTIQSNIHPSSIVHNLIAKGNYLYVSHYYDGFYIYDISDPANLTLAGYYNTSSVAHLNSFHGAWGIYPYLPSGNILVSDMQEGMFVFSAQSLSLQENKKQNFNINSFPNPFNQEINLVGDDLKEFSQYKLVDISGRVIQSGNLGQSPFESISIQQNISNGIYFLNFSGKGSEFSIKVMKN